MTPSPGALIAGKFRLRRPLAEGGMGSVWVGQNEQLDVPVAVKFMAPAFVGSAELVARFEREAKAAAQLRHPNVVQVFEHGVDGGTPYIVMELLEGESLGARLKARGRLGLGETSRILGEACLALRRAHERGLVHRDLKPANIFLCRHDDLEVVKVLDFGIAKSLSVSAEEEVTKSGAVLGSPHYMSPEQARRTNRAVDHRTDLWALGVIAFRCLTGRVPYQGEDAIDILVRVCTEPPPRASSIAPDLAPEVDAFLERALARDPDARFQSARELADALAVLANRSVRASVSASERTSWSTGPAATPWPATAPPAAPGPAAAPPAREVQDTTTTLPLLRPSGAGDPTGGPTIYSSHSAPPAVGAVAPAAPRPAAPGVFPASAGGGGTLTGAGTELSPGAGMRPRSLVIPLAAVAALTVIGLVVGVVIFGGGAGSETAPDPGVGVPGSAEQAPSTPQDPSPSVPPAASSIAPAEPSKSPAHAGSPAPSGSSISGASSPSASTVSGDAPVPSASSASPTHAPGAPASGRTPAPTPAKTGDSGFLRPAQF